LSLSPYATSRDDAGVSRGAPASPQCSKWCFLLALAVCLLAAGLLRWRALRDDFTLDEIWSLFIVEGVDAPHQLLTRVRHENNHLLNSLFIYALGAREDWSAYRLLSFAVGTGTVALIAAAARRWDRSAALTAAALATVSYPLVHYSAEARGYALVVFFSLLAFLALRRYLDNRGMGTAATFAASVALGMLSHPTFLYAYLGAAVWSIFRLYRTVGQRVAVGTLLRLHAAPVAFLFLFYLFQVRGMVVGGGPEYPLGAVLAQALSLTVGGPAGGVVAVLVAFCLVGLVAAELWTLRREGRDEWVFFTVAIFLAPAAILLLTRRSLVYPRHLLVATTFLLLIIGSTWARCWQRWWFSKAAAVLLLVLALCGHAAHLMRLYASGRGQYLEAVKYMAKHTRDAQITVGSDFDFRNYMVLRFYARYLPAGRSIRYYPEGTWHDGAPEWFLAHALDVGVAPPHRLVGLNGGSYVLARAFPHYGLSGWDWFVYRRTTPVPPERYHRGE